MEADEKRLEMAVTDNGGNFSQARSTAFSLLFFLFFFFLDEKRLEMAVTDNGGNFSLARPAAFLFYAAIFPVANAAGLGIKPRERERSFDPQNTSADRAAGPASAFPHFLLFLPRSFPLQ